MCKRLWTESRDFRPGLPTRRRSCLFRQRGGSKGFAPAAGPFCCWLRLADCLVTGWLVLAWLLAASVVAGWFVGWLGGWLAGQLGISGAEVGGLSIASILTAVAGASVLLFIIGLVKKG